MPHCERGLRPWTAMDATVARSTDYSIASEGAMSGKPTYPPATNPVRLRLWDQREFRASQPEWQELLARSGADPLFMSWNWQSCWWEHHAAPLGAELKLLAGYTSEGQLIGLAPLQLRLADHRWPLRSTRVEMLGCAWRQKTNVFSEYLDLLVDRRFEASFLRAVADHLLADPRWSELVLGNTRHDSLAGRMVREHFGGNCYLREADLLIAHAIDLPDSFEKYLQTLRSATRRKLWHHRRKLAEVRFELAAADELPQYFAQLDSFHQRRWGVRHYTGLHGRFHMQLAKMLAAQGLLRMSRLSSSGQTLSVMYNVRIGGREYNVQSGFDERVVRGISPGYLHFGYCIEHACEQGVRGFDFLAGPGQRREYKRDFGTKPTQMTTLQVIRSRPLAWLYRQYDRRRSPDSATTP